jgi:hypothetical protein
MDYAGGVDVLQRTLRKEVSPSMVEDSKSSSDRHAMI